MSDSLALVVIAVTFVLAGFVKGVVGLGLPTVAIGMLGLIMSPVQAAALLVVPSLITNLWQLFSGPALLPLVHRLRTLLLGTCGGTMAGALLLGTGGNGQGQGQAGAWLGAALIVYALFGLSARTFAVTTRTERWLSPLAGFATGLVTSATGVFVLPAVPYLQALGMPKDALVQALGLSFTVSTLALALALIAQGAFSATDAGASAAALLPALAGMLGGQWMRSRLRAATFRLCFFAGLFMLGAHLLLRNHF